VARLVVPPNITIITLPSKSPELNPVENIWRFMRDNWLSNRVFKSYERWLREEVIGAIKNASPIH
jgi:transposase